LEIKIYQRKMKNELDRGILDELGRMWRKKEERTREGLI
jgi:hypothetical protein